MNETSRLGINEEHVEKAEDYADSFAEDMLTYVHLTLAKLRNERQQALLEFIRTADNKFRIYDPLTFGIGAALTYNMVPDYQRHEPLGEEDIDSALQRILEYTDKEGVDLSWYTDLLQEDSPDFLEWAGSTIKQLGDTETKSDFVLGLTCMSLPFYLRGDSRTVSGE